MARSNLPASVIQEIIQDVRNPPITKAEAVVRTGLTKKQFEALIKENIFPQPDAGRRWRVHRFNAALEVLMKATDKVNPGYVYYMEMGDYIKIGWSDWPPNRRDVLQTATPYDIILLGAFPGSLENEQALHRMFAHCHKRDEWFHKSSGLLAWIAWLKIAWRGNADVIRGDLDNVVVLGEKTGTDG